jgi:hypothetical protein
VAQAKRFLFDLEKFNEWPNPEDYLPEENEEDEEPPPTESKDKKRKRGGDTPASDKKRKRDEETTPNIKIKIKLRDPDDAAPSSERSQRERRKPQSLYFI